MKNIKIRMTVAATMVTVLFWSCESFLEVELPENQLVASAVFNEKGTANAAMTEIYANMRDNAPFAGNLQGMSVALGCYTDELRFYGPPSGSPHPFFNNVLVASNPDMATWWNNAYNIIFACNTVIEGVEGSTGLLQADKERLKGEALMVRALTHTTLAGVFGPVPYITTSDRLQNMTPSRVPVQEVYNKAVSDLQMATNLLPTEYLLANRTRPNKATAQGLLARTLLYAGRYEEASEQASAVLNNTGMYRMDGTIQTQFLKESVATIWQLTPKNPNNNTLQGAAMIFVTLPPSSLALQQDLINAFEAGDNRKTQWTKALSNANGTWYHQFKYRQRTNTTTSVEHSILLRLGEVYLIRAEARARSGMLTAALDDLSAVRANAGLAPISVTNQDELLEAILKERRVELFTEYGHRFFDLKRFGKLDEVLAPTKTGWDNNDALFPIPQSELILNANLLPQNQGY